MSRALATADVMTSVTDTTSAIMTASRSSVVRYIWNLSGSGRNPTSSKGVVAPTKIRVRQWLTNVKRGRLRLSPYPRHKLSRHDYGYALAPTQTTQTKLRRRLSRHKLFARPAPRAPRPARVRAWRSPAPRLRETGLGRNPTAYALAVTGCETDKARELAICALIKRPNFSAFSKL